MKRLTKDGHRILRSLMLAPHGIVVSEFSVPCRAIIPHLLMRGFVRVRAVPFLGSIVTVTARGRAAYVWFAPRPRTTKEKDEAANHSVPSSI